MDARRTVRRVPSPLLSAPTSVIPANAGIQRKARASDHRCRVYIPLALGWSKGARFFMVRQAQHERRGGWPRSSGRFSTNAG